MFMQMYIQNDVEDCVDVNCFAGASGQKYGVIQSHEEEVGAALIRTYDYMLGKLVNMIVKRAP